MHAADAVAIISVGSLDSKAERHYCMQRHAVCMLRSRTYSEAKVLRRVTAQMPLVISN